MLKQQSMRFGAGWQHARHGANAALCDHVCEPGSAETTLMRLQSRPRQQHNVVHAKFKQEDGPSMTAQDPDWNKSAGQLAAGSCTASQRHCGNWHHRPVSPNTGQTYARYGANIVRSKANLLLSRALLVMARARACGALRANSTPMLLAFSPKPAKTALAHAAA